MVFCGYNDTMASGLKLFVEGMVEAMLARHDAGVPMEEVLRTELADLARLNAVLESGRRDSGDLLNGLIAINEFAQTIFSRSLGRGFDANRFADECRHSALAFVELIKVTEEQHLAQLRARGVGHGDPIAIELVGKWLLGNSADVVDGNSLDVAAD